MNLIAENKYGRTALLYASEYFDIIKLFQPFEECMINFPVHKFAKLILVGDSEAGKTTTVKLIIRLAKADHSVEPVPYKVKWPNFGHRLFLVTLLKTHRPGKKGLSLQQPICCLCSGNISLPPQPD